jgi:hypothetical protein
MSPKSVLLEECDNVRDLLNKTLRHDYGIDGSVDFYEECAARLDYLAAELGKIDERDLAALSVHVAPLNELSQLICRIERSSLGQYCWPFVEELKAISASICTERTIDSDKSPLKVYVLAEGGRDSYAIAAEKRRPTCAKRRLLTIQFPKSLKHFVLLHSVLGHEIGHAIWQSTNHENTLRQNAVSHLRHAGGQFEIPQSTAAWLYAANAPPEVPAFLAKIDPRINQHNIIGSWIVWESWLEELLCDLVGLVTFGPSFVAAQCKLFYSLDLTGMQVGPRHPLVAWRVNLMRRGARLLGFDASPPEGHPSRQTVTEFWSYVDSFVKADAWFNILSDQELLLALKGVQDLLTAHSPAAFVMPKFDVLEKLTSRVRNLVPPVGFEIDANGKVVCSDVDFRHILFAGWLESTRSGNELSFSKINQLCEHGIMQQRAIAISLRGGL